MSYCQCCHEDWPADFFCETCSSEPHLTITTQPVLMWDYIGPQTEEVVEYVTYSTCLNCCPGHKPPNHPPGGPAGVPESPEQERHPMSDRPA